MISFTGLILAIAFMSFFIWLFSGAYNFALKGNNESLLDDRKSKFIFLAFVFAGAWLCYWLLCQERYIYFWDYSGYWMRTVTNMKMLFSRPFLAVLKLGKGIFFSSYNEILPMLTAIPVKIAGYTFTRYVMINYFCFLAPAWFILLSVVKSVTEKRLGFSFMFIAFTFTAFYYAMLRGYIDVGCLIPASLSMLLLKDYDACTISREQVKRDIYISAVLLCTIMFRRYFAFYVEGYIFALSLLSVYSVFTNSGSESKFKLMRNALLNIIIIGLFALAVMLLFFAPMLINVLKNSYSTMYEGYNSPLMNKVTGLIKQFGAFTFIIAGLGVIMSLINKTMRRYACFSAASLIFTAGAFFYVQAMGYHQVYTLSVQLYILACICIAQIFAIKKGALRISAICLCFALISAGFAHCYLPASRPYVKIFSSLFGNTYAPQRRSDIHELNELADYLNSITTPEKRVYVLANSVILNSSILSNLNLPYEINHLHNAAHAHGVDIRDGFPLDLLSSDIIVIGDPVQLHMKPSSQETVRFPAVEIMSSDSQLGRHFVKQERTFTLDNGVKVYIYEKKSDFTQEDLQYIADYFTKVHPGHEKIFADRILGRIKPESYGRQTSNVIIKWLVRTGIYTPEDLAEYLNQTVQEIKARIQD